MWGGIDPKDSGNPAAAVANFSSLPVHKKREWVAAAVHMSYDFQDQKRLERHRKERIVRWYEWPSYLTKEELMMWGLDQEEAENLYNRSQEKEKPYDNRNLNSRLGKLVEEGRIDKKLYEELITSILYEESPPFTTLNLSQSDEEGACSEIINIRDEKKRKQILHQVKSFRKKLNKLEKELIDRRRKKEK